ncbi:MAG TPA: flagellar hook-basal body complex protein FliE [Beijerinckiaceae bacterium]|jgi:flagellar hook-basal body complex protein FliE
MLNMIAPLLGAGPVSQTPNLGGTAGAAAAQGATADFSTVMANLASETATSLKTAEASSILGLQGKASVQQVVEALMTAERNLQTVVAVRDKVVSAYQEISRMQI